ncbi:uncharacterized protein G2W53_001555 [Senna tora]|uniref:AIR9-like A9 domain-containing protein n=1 Tax=Senna tora TaxID=362788 RepID=A0A835CLL4_9FABA|nr:uncharacterized protein G2W53_001555 [Senna tora]
MLSLIIINNSLFLPLLDRIRDLSSVRQSLGGNGNHVESPGSGNLGSHIHNQSTIQHDFPWNNLIRNEQQPQPMSKLAGYAHNDVFMDVRNPVLNGDMNLAIDRVNRQDLSKADREESIFRARSTIDKDGLQERDREENIFDGMLSQPPLDHDETASSVYEDGPGIENFQIIGDAVPGEKLLGCGYQVRGTSLCMFQWVRHLQDGTRHYIEGATNPEYVVTADDVDKLIAVECIPMDDKGRQDHKGISDGEMCNNIRVDHGVKVKEQGNNSTFRKVLRIFLEDGEKWRVRWVLERQDVARRARGRTITFKSGATNAQEQRHYVVGGLAVGRCHVSPPSTLLQYLWFSLLFHDTGGTQLLRGVLDGVSGHSRRLCSSVLGGYLSTVAGLGLVALWSFYVTRWPAALVISDGLPPSSAVVLWSQWPELIFVSVCEFLGVFKGCGLLPALVCVGWGSLLSVGCGTVILGLVCGVAGLNRVFCCRILRVAVSWAVE